jgi:hypothetical protein
VRQKAEQVTAELMAMKLADPRSSGARFNQRPTALPP